MHLDLQKKFVEHPPSCVSASGENYILDDARIQPERKKPSMNDDNATENLEAIISASEREKMKWSKILTLQASSYI